MRSTFLAPKFLHAPLPPRVKVGVVPCRCQQPDSAQRGTQQTSLPTREAKSPERASIYGDDYPLLAEPLEAVLPRFTREVPDSIPLDQPPTKLTVMVKGRRGRRRFGPVDSKQAFLGSVISGGCAAGVARGVYNAHTYVVENPVAHNLPFNLTAEVNSMVTSTVTIFGGLAVVMFGFTSVGLLVLSLSRLQTPSPSPSPSTTTPSPTSGEDGMTLTK